MKQPGNKRYWLDNPRNVTKVYWTLVLVCTLAACTDLFYHKEVHFAFERLFNFHGFYGFTLSVFLVLTAKGLRPLLMRKEDYYD